jgi:hypothetical protein
MVENSSGLGISSEGGVFVHQRDLCCGWPRWNLVQDRVEVLDPRLRASGDDT